MIARSIDQTIRRFAGIYPVVTLPGTRQCGKTTLAKDLFRDYTYINLENPRPAASADADPMSFVERNPAPLIIDEAQRVPSLASAIQVAVDERRDVNFMPALHANRDAGQPERRPLSPFGRTPAPRPIRAAGLPCRRRCWQFASTARPLAPSRCARRAGRSP